jgi:hypothetical protein
MLSVKTVRDTFLLVNLVEHPVSVVLHGCSEDNNFVELTHLLQELVASRSDSEGAFSSNLVVMHKRFIEI